MKNPALAFGAGFLFFCATSTARAQTRPQAQTKQDVPSQTLERNDSERQLFDLLNDQRAAWGLGELHWDEALFKAARKHALLMADQDTMAHQLPGEPNLEERLTAAGARFSLISENIAIGGSPATIHEGWMNSPGHRRNILEPHVTAVGIAVVHGRNGLFAVEDFSHSFVSLSAEQQEKQISALLTAKGFHVDGAAEEARKACDGKPEMTGLRPLTLFRFEAPDLAELPPGLEKKIHSEHYRNVTVGACSTREAAGFARYRMALLFY